MTVDGPLDLEQGVDPAPCFQRQQQDHCRCLLWALRRASSANSAIRRAPGEEPTGSSRAHRSAAGLVELVMAAIGLGFEDACIVGQMCLGCSSIGSSKSTPRSNQRSFWPRVIAAWQAAYASTTRKTVRWQQSTFRPIAVPQCVNCGSINLSSIQILKFRLRVRLDVSLDGARNLKQCHY